MKIFKRLLAYAKPYGRYWPSYLVLSILSVIFGIVNYALLGPLLTVLFEADTITTIPAKPEFSFTVEYFKNFFSYQLAGTIGRSGVVQDRKSVV